MQDVLRDPMQPTQTLVKMLDLGIQATDVNLKMLGRKRSISKNEYTFAKI